MPPQEKYTNKEGEEKWADKIWFNKEDETAKNVLNSINEVVVKAYKKEKSGGTKKPKQSDKPSNTEGSFDEDW
jgi:hypothetical protein